METKKPLHLYEEIMLLALKEKEGTLVSNFVELLVAGAVMSELLLNQRVSISKDKKQHVQLLQGSMSGDAVMDLCVKKIVAAKRAASLQVWISRLAHIPKLRHLVAEQLCRRKILRADEKKALLMFRYKVYPEINAEPEKEILKRLREALFSDGSKVDPQTSVLVVLANATGLLAHAFGKKELKSRQKRLKEIAEGNLVGKATQQVIQSTQAAIMMATMVPIICAS